MLAKAGALCPHLLPLLLAGLFVGPAMAAEQKKGTASPPEATPFSPGPGYAVKPSEVIPPADVPLGQYLRITRPFPNWTLICDENLAKKQRVCNISQSIIDSNGTAIFSWSLAASQDGQPFFILRALPSLGEKGTITLDLRDGGPLVSVPLQGCDETVCLGYQQVGPRLRAAVAKGAPAKVTYGQGATLMSFEVPLAGLSSALDAI